MADSSTTRRHGLLLMGAGVLTFVGTTGHLLPAEAFFPALGVCLLGVLLFMKGNRTATEEAEQRIKSGLDPNIRNESMERYAARQAQVDGLALESIATQEARRAPAAPPVPLAPTTSPNDEIVLDELTEVESNDDADADDDFVISTDVSFPVELQESQSLAEQLQKLNRLREDGVISTEEFNIAKAKLLG